MEAYFDNYEISGCKRYGAGTPDSYDEQASDDEAEFWSLYGHIPGSGVECIGDFHTRAHAEEIFTRITGLQSDVRKDFSGVFKAQKAASDLLEALEELHNACRFWDDQDDPALVKARAAIAKASGGAPCQPI